ncbi:MAG: glycerol-3-phosphate 1-O-acyltransferase PlsY [Candidatus Omnitrophica bacterium]|nr:glycerol-3-phosphate 1-O-acyltransferase PlsY [Candidatus Omnitrophota bacterium]
MLTTIIALSVSYLIGSIPTAYIFGRLTKGIDIRKHGSGNVGATNAFRILGRGIGLTVLAIDIAKGLAVVLLAQQNSGSAILSPEMFRLLCGICAIIGHTWTVFLRFKGGKGMATTLGVLIGLSIYTPYLGTVLLLLFLIWVLVFVFSRIVSAASLASAIAFPFLSVLLKQSPVLIATSIFLSLFVIVRHKSNIQRLLQGKEPRLKLGR